MLRTRCKKRPVIAGQKSGYFVKEYNLFIILTGKNEKLKIENKKYSIFKLRNIKYPGNKDILKNVR
ncbi:probable protein [Bacillus thuringiensis serovar tolworthi]|uniref:Probable protein n=1 Tax=Bacillus thuringiensis subsp. tolworthi TaxID=1442 RepID=A0A9W4A0U3_BACTO|nr:probable protein [Bacillus thuringiensis serovar tolworthi]